MPSTAISRDPTNAGAQGPTTRGAAKRSAPGTKVAKATKSAKSAKPAKYARDAKDARAVKAAKLSGEQKEPKTSKAAKPSKSATVSTAADATASPTTRSGPRLRLIRPSDEPTVASLKQDAKASRGGPDPKPPKKAHPAFAPVVRPPR